MKELSIEEKAKRYDEAVNEIKNLRDMLLKEGVINKNGVIWDNFNRIFPEFKESEDERIRKDIIVLIKDWWDRVNKDNISTKEQMLAWLEKQGERKSLDDIAKEVIKNKDAAISFLKSTGIMNENGELADEYKIEQVEQNPAWSEEDERMYKGLHNLIYSTPYCDSRKEFSDWFKSLKERVQPQNTWKPSNEQMEGIECTIKTLKYQLNCGDNRLDSLYNDLKKLRDK